MAPKWSIGHPQFSSTALCPELVVEFGAITGLYATDLVGIIFSNFIIGLWPTMVLFA